MIGKALASIPARWLDWFFVLVLLAAAGAATRMVRADYRQALAQAPSVPFRSRLRMLTVPLFMVPASLAVAALGTAIGEDYWELRAFALVFVLWALSFLLYAAALINAPQGEIVRAGRGPIIIGLILSSLSLFLPALLGSASQESVSQFSHAWFLLVAISVAFLLAGVLKGHPHRFPMFAAGLGILQLVGWGATELVFASPAFPWLVRVWNLTLSADYISSFPRATAWRVAGALKILAGMVALACLLINARRRHFRAPQHNGPKSQVSPDQSRR